MNNSNTGSSLYSGGLDQDTRTIMFEIMVFLMFGGGLRGIYKWFKTSNFRFEVQVKKGKCSFDCKSADAEEPEKAIQTTPQVEVAETQTESKV